VLTSDKEDDLEAAFASLTWRTPEDGARTLLSNRVSWGAVLAGVTVARWHHRRIRRARETGLKPLLIASRLLVTPLILYLIGIGLDAASLIREGSARAGSIAKLRSNRARPSVRMRFQIIGGIRLPPIRK
jgi:hypothetical protein